MKKIFLTIALVLLAGSAMADDNDNVKALSISNVTRIIDHLKNHNPQPTDNVDADNDNDINDAKALSDCILRKSMKIYGYEFVDLGLPSGMLWATVNVGAEKAEDYGTYFAWGETEGKSTYDWSNYAEGQANALTKYNNNISYGTVDNKVTLELSDDAARANMGGYWRMPTNTEIAELRSSANCTWTVTTQNEVKGYKVTSKKNGNSIFLPFGGYVDKSVTNQAGSTGYYWSSTLNESTPTTAYCMVIDNSNFTHCNIRSWGRSVRGVIK